MCKIFVYGTLRKGQSRNVILENSRYLGFGKTKKEFTLYSLGEFPAAVQHGDHYIFGDIYDVDDATLKFLDQIEDHPNLYIRTPITLSNGYKVQTYILPSLFLKNTNAEKIPSGDWTLFLREREINNALVF